MVFAFAAPGWAASTGEITLTLDFSGLSSHMTKLFGMMGAAPPPEADSGRPIAVTFNGHIFIQGDNLRIALADPTGASAGAVPAIEIMVNKSDNKLYFYYPDTLNGVAVDLGQAESSGLAESGALTGNRNYRDLLGNVNAKSVGKETILGHESTGYAFKIAREGGRTVMVDMWVADDLGFPIAVRTRSDMFNMTWEVKNLKTTPDKGVGFFRPPQDAALRQDSAASILGMAGM